MSPDQKINLLIIIMTFYVVILLIGAIPRLTYELDSQRRTNRNKKLDTLDAKGQHNKVLELADGYLKTWPNETRFIWAKARAHFQLNNFSEASKIFDALASKEPLWAEDAQKYIAAINHANSNT